jgi:hypothetical protein
MDASRSSMRRSASASSLLSQGRASHSSFPLGQQAYSSSAYRAGQLKSALIYGQPASDFSEAKPSRDMWRRAGEQYAARANAWHQHVWQVNQAQAMRLRKFVAARGDGGPKHAWQEDPTSVPAQPGGPSVASLADLAVYRLHRAPPTRPSAPGAAILRGAAPRRPPPVMPGQPLPRSASMASMTSGGGGAHAHRQAPWRPSVAPQPTPTVGSAYRAHRARRAAPAAPAHRAPPPPPPPRGE